jgi:hypothetical protein
MTARFPVGARVLRSDNSGPATVSAIDGEYYEITYDEGGSGWWPGTALNWLGVPQWVQFGVGLGVSPTVNAFVASLAQAAPVLHLMIGVGLGQAAQGDPNTFLTGWAQCRTAGLVPPELLADVVALANDYGLPAEFVAQLGAEG